MSAPRHGPGTRPGRASHLRPARGSRPAAGGADRHRRSARLLQGRRAHGHREVAAVRRRHHHPHGERPAGRGGRRQLRPDRAWRPEVARANHRPPRQYRGHPRLRALAEDQAGQPQGSRGQEARAHAGQLAGADPRQARQAIRLRPRQGHPGEHAAVRRRGGRLQGRCRWSARLAAQPLSPRQAGRHDVHHGHRLVHHGEAGAAHGRQAAPARLRLPPRLGHVDQGKAQDPESAHTRAEARQ